MKYNIIVYEGGKFDVASLKNENVEIVKMEVPITINKIKADGYNIKIEEKIKFIDFMKQRKFGDKEIDELAEDAVDSMLPNSSPEDKERAKKNYLERTKIIVTEKLNN